LAEHPERPKDLEKILNTQERRAHLIVDLLEDRAQRIVDVLDEPPPGTTEQSNDQVKAMWNFSRYPDPAAMFWMVHDQILGQALQQILQQPMDGASMSKAIAGAHQQAEMEALAKVYPHRGELVLLGITTPERSVELAEHAAKLVEQDDKRRTGFVMQRGEAAY
jgi:hypothetical protein